jgi:hypothetical protein
MRNWEKKSLKIRHLEVCLQVTSETFFYLKKFNIFLKFFIEAFGPMRGKKKGSQRSLYQEA